MTVSVELRCFRRSSRLAGRLAGLAALCALAVAAAPALGQDAGDVVATVDGSPITAGDVSSTAAEMASALQNYAPADHAAVVLEFLVNEKLMAAAARKAGIEDTPDFAHRMELVRERELRDAYFDKAVRQTITEDDIKAAYDKVAEQAAQREELHASHILLETKEEAEAIIKELKDGADFAELAKQKSIGPSGKDGGDLGFFTENDVAAPFFKAAAALETGQLSEPVQTQFGWHVIKLMERRPAAAPPLEVVRDEIENFLVRQKYVSLINELKAAAKIEMVEQPKADQTDAQPAPAEQPAQPDQPAKPDAQ